jgi:hypothetical protein
MNGTFYPATNSGQVSGVTCYASEAEVKKAAGSYAKIVRVDGGWLVFDTMTDYDTWRKQK